MRACASNAIVLETTNEIQKLGSVDPWIANANKPTGDTRDRQTTQPHNSTTTTFHTHRFPTALICLCGIQGMGGTSDDERDPLKRNASDRDTASLRAYVVDAIIFILWACLEIVDALLRVLGAIYSLIEKCAAVMQSDATTPQQIVIVGASFGGLAAKRELSHQRNVKVTLIDFKSYFEYTPGVLRCLVQPSYLSQLTCPLPTSPNELITGAMCGVTEDTVLVRDSSGAERRVHFDYLVMAVGSTYADPIKPCESESTLTDRAVTWTDAAAKLAGAESVIIVGAGAVGVELAGEILTVYPHKRVMFVDMATTILPGFDRTASDYSRAWLERRGAELVLGEAIERISAESLLLKSGQQIEAGIVYKCVGVMPNTAMLKHSPFAASFGFRDSIEVNDHLQVAGHPHVYCVGDMMSHSSRELKLGHTAEVNAHLAAHNILADLNGKPLLTYPHGVTGADTTPKIYCLSLGRYDAIMGFNGYVLSGWYVAVMKWLLEWTKVAAAAERPIGVLFWRVADGMSMWLGRTLLAPSKKESDDDGSDVEKGIPKVHGGPFPHPQLDFLKNPVFADMGMLLLRVVTASLILHHGLDKLENTAGFSNGVIAVYFPFLPGPPVFWTYLSSCFEIVGSFCITVGIFARPAAALLAGTMVNAIAFHLMKFGLQSFPFNPPKGGAYTFEPSFAFLGVTAHICLAGPGRCAVQPHFPKLDFLKNPVFADMGMLLLRVVTASLILHHGLDKLENTAGFSNGVIAVYFPFLPGPPVFWTYLSSCFEIVGSFCITVGIFARPAAALLAGTMVNAIAFHLMKFGLQSFPFNPPKGGAYTFEPSFAFLGVTAYICLAGPGRFAVRSSGF